MLTVCHLWKTAIKSLYLKDGHIDIDINSSKLRPYTVENGVETCCAITG